MRITICREILEHLLCGSSTSIAGTRRTWSIGRIKDGRRKNVHGNNQEDTASRHYFAVSSVFTGKFILTPIKVFYCRLVLHIISLYISISSYAREPSPIFSACSRQLRHSDSGVELVKWSWWSWKLGSAKCLANWLPGMGWAARQASTQA